jgi:26S proteasome regulatory subunit N2
MEVELSSGKDGDISPINRSISNLAEESSASTSKLSKMEPTFEIRPNFSRVTPAQLAHISFPAEGRYQPVRPVSTTTISRVVPPSGPLATGTSEKFAGGGGILILTDLRPDEEGEFIEFEPLVEPAAPDAITAISNSTVAGAPLSGPQFALDDSATEESLPEPFEVRSCVYFPVQRC